MSRETSHSPADADEFASTNGHDATQYDDAEYDDAEYDDAEYETDGYDAEMRDFDSADAEDEAAYPEYDSADHPRDRDQDLVDTGVHARYVDDEDDDDLAPRQRAEGPRRTDHAREMMLARRRRTLMVLGVLAPATLVAALFLGGWAAWSVQLLTDFALVGYLWHLRNEAIREEERRQAREERISQPRRRSDTTLRRGAAAERFLADDVDQAVVRLDDEDPAFYDLTDSPVAQGIDLQGGAAGYHSTSHETDPQSYDDYDGYDGYDGYDDGWDYKKAVGA